MKRTHPPELLMSPNGKFSFIEGFLKYMPMLARFLLILVSKAGYRLLKVFNTVYVSVAVVPCRAV